MHTDLTTILAVLGMGAATYLTRVAGLFLATRMRIGGRGEAFLRGIPGAILISLVAPAVASSGPADALAAAATVCAAVLSRSLLLSMVIGVAAACLLRGWIGA